MNATNPTYKSHLVDTKVNLGRMPGIAIAPAVTKTFLMRGAGVGRPPLVLHRPKAN